MVHEPHFEKLCPGGYRILSEELRKHPLPPDTQPVTVPLAILSWTLSPFTASRFLESKLALPLDTCLITQSVSKRAPRACWVLGSGEERGGLAPALMGPLI